MTQPTNIPDNENAKFTANAVKVHAILRKLIAHLVPGALDYFDIVLSWRAPEDNDQRVCRVLLVKSAAQPEHLMLPNRRASLQLLSTVVVTPSSVIVPTFGGELHASTDGEIEAVLTAAVKEQSIGNIATVGALVSERNGKQQTKPAVAFNVDKFKVALANAEAAGTARQDMYRAAVQAIDTINDVLGPKRTGRLKVSYLTTTDYKNHVVLAFSWEPVEDVSDWFRVCALPMPMDTRPWVTKSYPLDVIAIQNANTTVLVENRNSCTDLVEAVINSEPFMTWLAQHTLGTA